MRGFIQFSAGLFVILGMLGFIAAAGVVITIFQPQGGPVVPMLTYLGVAGAIYIVIAAAAVTLIGGTAYMLCSIDKRLEARNT